MISNLNVAGVFALLALCLFRVRFEWLSQRSPPIPPSAEMAKLSRASPSKKLLQSCFFLMLKVFRYYFSLFLACFSVLFIRLKFFFCYRIDHFTLGFVLSVGSQRSTALTVDVKKIRRLDGWRLFFWQLTVNFCFFNLTLDSQNLGRLTVDPTSFCTRV